MTTINAMERIAQFKSREILDINEPSAYLDYIWFLVEEKLMFSSSSIAMATFLPLLEANRTKIQEIPRETFQYGPTDRHQVYNPTLSMHQSHLKKCYSQLDVYYPITPSTTGKTQILVWVYGGGFVSGERRLPAPADLVYATVGSFFAHRGFIVVIPDYRLAPSTIFPGAAEDVRDAILWIIKNPQCLTTPTTPKPDTKGIFLMGHSAGAIHAFASIILPPTPEATLLPRIAGLILHAGVHQWKDLDPSLPFFKIVAQHYGGAEHMNQRSSFGLLRDASASTLAMLPRTLLVLAEMEPEWLLKSNEGFGRALEASSGKKSALLVAKGHNHISPNLALSSGQGEKWAEDVIAWIK